MVSRGILLVILICDFNNCDLHELIDIGNGTTTTATLPSTTMDIFYQHFFSPLAPPANMTDLATSDSPSLFRHARDRWRVPVHKGNLEIGIRRKGNENGARLSYESVADIWHLMESFEVSETVSWTKPQVDHLSTSLSNYNLFNHKDTEGSIKPEPIIHFNSSLFIHTDSNITENAQSRSSQSQEFNSLTTFRSKYYDGIEVPEVKPQISAGNEVPTRTTANSRLHYRRSHPELAPKQENGRQYMIINAKVNADRSPVQDDGDILAERVEKPGVVARRTRLRSRTQSLKRSEWPIVKQSTPQGEISRSATHASHDSPIASNNFVQTPPTPNRTIIVTGLTSTIPSDQTAPIPQDHVKFFEYYDTQESKEELSKMTIEQSKNENDLRLWKPGSRDTRRHAIEVIRRSSEAPPLKSGPTRWFDYPFMAMYVFEPADVHCDAAAISPRWLVTSGRCLRGRRWRGAAADEEAAYVAYCGVRWDRPRRINYVELELFHPAYESDHPEYNIGAVKVAISMEACDGWQPVGVWQHRLEAGEALHDALTVGWGLCGRAGAARQHRRRALQAARADLRFASCPRVQSGGRAEGVQAGQELTYCVVTAAAAAAPHASCGGVLVSGGRLLGLWLQEDVGGGGNAAVHFSAVWRACPWLRSATHVTFLR